MASAAPLSAAGTTGFPRRCAAAFTSSNATPGMRLVAPLRRSLQQQQRQPTTLVFLQRSSLTCRAAGGDDGQQPAAEQQQQQGQEQQQAAAAAARRAAVQDPSVAKGQRTAIVTGAISIIFGVIYLGLVSFLDMRGGELLPPPPEAYLP